MTNDEIRKALTYCYDNSTPPYGPQVCTLCGNHPDLIIYFGIFIPRRQELVGALGTKTRGFVYLLCSACYATSDKFEHLEEKILVLMEPGITRAELES